MHSSKSVRKLHFVIMKNGMGADTKGLKREEIPISARIMALADVYDALRSKRVYKESYSHEKKVWGLSPREEAVISILF